MGTSMTLRQVAVDTTARLVAADLARLVAADLVRLVAVDTTARPGAADMARLEAADTKAHLVVEDRLVAVDPTAVEDRRVVMDPTAVEDRLVAMEDRLVAVDRQGMMEIRQVARLVVDRRAVDTRLSQVLRELLLRETLLEVVSTRHRLRLIRTIPMGIPSQAAVPNPTGKSKGMTRMDRRRHAARRSSYA